jgi:biotin-dependent carboxylase-like uncharacterized protein
MAPALHILRPGMLTTVQDLGRFGYQHLGVAVGGALDPISLRAANALVGNDPGVGSLESAYAGPTFLVEAESVRLACVGADASIEVLQDETAASGIRIPCLQSFTARRGEVVRIGTLTGSSVLYTAVAGGFAINPVLGSVSTFVRGAIGGWHGRALAAGDRLPLLRDTAAPRAEFRLQGLDLSVPRRYRAIIGPQNTCFPDRAIRAFFEREYIVQPQSDRMALHLTGCKLDHVAGFDIVSDGIASGSVQVPGSGQPLVLLADRQTTGGYPKIATVVSADLPALGRARIGNTIVFEPVSIEQAQELRRKLFAEIEAIPQRLVPVRRAAEDITTRLLESNLISGAVDACDWPLAAA